MAERDDCIEDILKAAGGRKNRKWAEAELDDMDARAREHASRFGSSYEDGLRKAARDKIDEEMANAAIRRRNERHDMMKSRNLNRWADDVMAIEALGKDAGRLAAEAPLVGVNTPLFSEKASLGNQLSAAALGLGAKRDWIGGAIDDLHRIGEREEKFAGLDKVFFSRQIEDDIFREKYELDRGEGGSPGRTKNEAARKIAEVLHKWDKVKVNALNSEGAWISDYLGWMTSTTHDPDRLRKAADQRAFRRGWTEQDRQAWVGKTLPLIDAKRTFGTTEEADKKLAEMWGGLIDGSHMDYATVTSEPIYASVAGRVSQSRAIHWKDADSWLTYNREFGRFGPTETWLHSMHTSADRWGLMKLFGSKPKEGFDNLVAYIKNNLRGTEARAEFNTWAPDDPEATLTPLKNRFDVVSGAAARPVASNWAGLVNGVLATQRLAKLGLTPFAMLQDNVTVSRELSRQGLGFLERNTSILTDYFQGAKESEKRHVADLLHTGVMERLYNQTSRFDIGEVRSGRVAGALGSMENIFFKITGITPMTANKRAGAERMMARHYGLLKDTEFAALEPEEQRTMQAFGLGAKEWDLLRTAEWNTIEGKTYLTPDIARRLSDDAVKGYMKSRALTDQLATVGISGETAIAKVKNELAAKLWSYFSERGQFAVLEVGARERAMLYQGTRPGTPLNLALKMLMQFKQFPTAMVTKAWGADIYGGAKGFDRIAGLTELLVGSTLFGALANYLNPIAKGMDPNAPWRNQPVAALVSAFNRGGAGSIYGDLLMGEWSRFGLSALDTLVGPTLGQTNKAFELLTYLTHPSKWKADWSAKFGTLAARTARENLPFGNMIYTKAAVDYLFYYRLMEYLHPGYLDRMQQNAREKQGTEFWLRPTQVQSQGLLPALGQATGLGGR